MIDFEELDYRPTPMGDLSLRRRGEPRLEGREVYEVKLGDEFLMSSLFSEGEIALTKIGLDSMAGRESMDVVVGGLGLGYTAVEALKNSEVASLLIVETMEAVIEWHSQGLVPLGKILTADPRTRYVHGDFFSMARAGSDGFDPQTPGRTFDAILLDIDHSPEQLLSPAHADFYTADGLTHLKKQLNKGGVFSLWSNDPPESGFEAVLDGVFGNAASHVVEFDNPFMGGTSTNTVYVANA